MSPTDQNKPVIMVRDNLEKLPEFPLPDGYSFRFYQPGDEEHWINIELAVERFIPISLDLYWKVFGKDVAVIRERQIYLFDSRDTPVGTATAWFKDDFKGERYGQVHWVAIVPAHQGRGLAKPLMSAVCRRLAELGHDRAFLATSSTRIPAINLYRHFGFRPEINAFSRQDTWDEIEPLLKKP